MSMVNHFPPGIKYAQWAQIFLTDIEYSVMGNRYPSSQRQPWVFNEKVQGGDGHIIAHEKISAIQKMQSDFSSRLVKN